VLTEGSDIEHLISLFQSSGTVIHLAYANTLKKYFRDEIFKNLKKVKPKLGDFRKGFPGTQYLIIPV